MSSQSASAVVCREVFDENSQPSAEEITEYAQQLGIDPESESHLLPLARDGLMQALPPPWKAYYDEKLQTHYYYNEETKKTQWEHPLDNVYRELVKKARDASMHDDTCASVQELLTSEENTKNLERVETKVESDDEGLSTDSGENHASDVKDNASTLVPRRLTPIGRPPLARFDKKLGDLRISPLRRSADSPVSGKPTLVRNISDRDILSRSTFDRPKLLFKQHSEIIDLKMHVLNNPDEENYSSLLSNAKVEKGLQLTGKGGMFLKAKSDLPSPDIEKSLPLDSMTKSDPPKGILREKLSETLQRKAESVVLGKPRQTASFEEDRKSVRFKLENLPEPTISPGSNSSSEQNDGQSSIISATPAPTVPSPIIPSSPSVPSPVIPSSLLIPSPIVPTSGISSPVVSSPVISSPPMPSTTSINPIVLSPLTTRPPLPPRPQISDSSREMRSFSGSDRDSLEGESRESRGTSPRRRLLRPPAADYIKPDLFQKNFQKISDLVRPGDIESAPVNLEEPLSLEKESRPRSPMIPQKNKISINLMESIESETSIDSPDREFANLDLNDLDDSNDNIPEKDDQKDNNNEIKESEEKDLKDTEENSKKLSVQTKTSYSLQSKSPRLIDNIPMPQIKVPKLELLSKSKSLHSESDDSKKTSIRDESKTNSMSESIEIKDKSPQLKLSPTPSLLSDLRSPRYEKHWSSPLSTFKPLNKGVIASQIKSSDSANSLGKGLSPRLDGVILSQGKSNSDNVVLVYQFETQDEYSKPIKSPVIPDIAARDMMERNKADERRRLELSLQKDLESIRLEWTTKERKMRAELQEELKEAEEKFLMEKRARIAEQEERHRREMEDTLASVERNHQQALQEALKELDEKYKRDAESAEKQHEKKMEKIREEYHARLLEQQEHLAIDNEQALAELREQLQANLNRDRARMIEENRATIESLREEHTSRVTDLRHDYRAEVERLRTQHACHLEELRARLANERAASSRHNDERAVAEKYKCLKEKYARLKHDVKMSIERRNKRREMSMTTGSETEKSNSHKATQSLGRCKEVNETSISAAIEPEPARMRVNNNPSIKYNDNETSYSESAHKSCDNNNREWKQSKEATAPSTSPCPPATVKRARAHRRTAVAFREPPRRNRDADAALTTDCQDSSDATTADEKPKEVMNGHGRRRCFTRLKSASTSRLNYSPKRGEGWSSPLESLRQQLRKLDDLEDQFPDLACQPSYSLRYPFAELDAVTRADTPELEFVRHRALVEREGMRRARAVLKRRKAALRESRATLSPHRAPSEATTSDASSESEAIGETEAENGGAVLRSLRALHADVRDIWRALDARRPHTASPETSSCNPPSTSQARMILSAPAPSMLDDNSDGGVAERARGLKAWLHTAP